jgi:hypothetical protein
MTYKVPDRQLIFLQLIWELWRRKGVFTVFILVRVYAARGAEEEELEVVTMTYNEEILDSWILLRCKDFSLFSLKHS